MPEPIKDEPPRDAGSGPVLADYVTSYAAPAASTKDAPGSRRLTPSGCRVSFSK